MAKTKKIKVKYETEKSYRWGICMKFAKALYHSRLSVPEIVESLENIADNFDIKIKK